MLREPLADCLPSLPDSIHFANNKHAIAQLMKKTTKRLLGGLALAAGALGLGSALLQKKNPARERKRNGSPPDVWARPGMKVTFRAEVMPGRETNERSFRVKEVLPSGRVVLQGFAGEHAEKEFERVQ